MLSPALARLHGCREQAVWQRLGPDTQFEFLLLARTGYVDAIPTAWTLRSAVNSLLDEGLDAIARIFAVQVSMA